MPKPIVNVLEDPKQELRIGLHCAQRPDGSPAEVLRQWRDVLPRC